MSNPRRNKEIQLALLALPALTLAVCIVYLVIGQPLAGWAMLATILACLASFYGGAVALAMLDLRRKTSTLLREKHQAEQQAEFHESRNRTLQSQLEILSAMREVSRAASGEVSFEDIFSQVLVILEDLLTSRELIIYLPQEGSDNLVPKAHRTPEGTTFGDKINAALLDDSGILDALRYRTILRSMDDDLLSFVVPLDSDQGPIGVMKVSLEMVGAPEEQEEKSEHFERMLRDLSRHISLAVKTTLLQDQAHSDTMTGLYNKGYFLDQLPRFVHFAQRKSDPLALIMLDIDHFKSINDNYGHLTGDRILEALARILKSNLRKYDTAYRYGGEELAVILPSASLSQALKLGERIRKKVESRTFRGEKKERIRLTVSIGVAELSEEMSDPSKLISRADQALYKAKEAGRNQVQALAAEAA